MILVIAEKPSVAQSIAKVLGANARKDGCTEGNGYIVSWCVGHLVELADASSYDERYAKWRREDLPILPENWLSVVSKDKEKQFSVLRSLMNDNHVTELVCATDAGREGELIFRLVYHKAGCTKPFKRLWISSLEDEAIREGFAHLRDGSEFDRLYEAALSRSKADWIVGINGTRLFTTLYNKRLVVGRVQTPTLAMLAERDSKISNFKKEKYFNVHVGKDSFTADMEKIKTENEANRLPTATPDMAVYTHSHNAYYGYYPSDPFLFFHGEKVKKKKEPQPTPRKGHRLRLSSCVNKGGFPTFFRAVSLHLRQMGKHTGLPENGALRGLKPPFSTFILTVFSVLGSLG